MQTFYTNNKQNVDLIINLFKEKKVAFSFLQQYSFIKAYNVCNKDVEISNCDNYVYVFLWSNKKVKLQELQKICCEL